MNNKEKLKSNHKLSKMRKTISMIIVTLLLMSSATYAWFALNGTATLSNLTMKSARESGGLLLSEQRDSGYGEELIVKTPLENVFFLPATVQNALPKVQSTLVEDTTRLQITKPVYTNAQVSEVLSCISEDSYLDKVTEITDADKHTYYEFQKTFYMKSPGKDGSTTIKLVGSDTTYSDGTFIKKTDSHAEESIRIALTAKIGNEFQTKILAYDMETDQITGTQAEYMNGYKGYMNYGGLTLNTPYTQSLTTLRDGIASDDIVVFTGFPTKEPVEVTLQIWFEGTDDQCVNEIMASNISAQLAFTQTGN